jgi:hypothetical protein
MKKELMWKGKYGQTDDIIDDGNTRNHLFSQIKNQIDDMFNSIQGKGHNPFTLNFFSFCGHGVVNAQNEAIFLVPQF